MTRQMLAITYTCIGVQPVDTASSRSTIMSSLSLPHCGSFQNETPDLSGKRTTYQSTPPANLFFPLGLYFQLLTRKIWRNEEILAYRACFSSQLLCFFPVGIVARIP